MKINHVCFSRSEPRKDAGAPHPSRLGETSRLAVATPIRTALGKNMKQQKDVEFSPALSLSRKSYPHIAVIQSGNDGRGDNGARSRHD
ncbi:MAG: hypothetical protein WBW74_01835 [Xanthobacteraceae bacterium]